MRCLALICVFVSVAHKLKRRFTPFHKSGIYELGGKAGWNVTLAQDAGYPNWPSENPQVMETALYFDIVNFASRIRE
jgi:hypothetical protein